VLRIYLSGSMSIEAGGELFGPDTFPAQQGRVAFALLVGERGPASRTALAEALWPDRPPAAWETALSSIVSKLRSLLTRAGLDGASSLITRDGCHELRLPSGTWIDHDVAADSIHEAEAALRAGDPARAYGPSAVAHHIARRPFLPGEYGRWVEQRRDKLTSILVRALECRAEVYLWNGEHPLAVEAARDALVVEPFRETAWQLLMRAHAAAGNTAEALRAYERCRSLIADELGVNPSPQTKAVHAELLASL
jgi:SARP family transcriptional regulator, regulator of embCAB operon